MSEKEFESFFDIINIFLVYYKRANENEDVISKLKEIDYTKGTFENKFMDVFFNAIEKEKKNKHDIKEITIYNPVDKEEYNNYDYMYVLEIKKKKHKLCHTLMPLIRYVSLIKSWPRIEWKIYQLRSL